MGVSWVPLFFSQDLLSRHLAGEGSGFILGMICTQIRKLIEVKSSTST